eukprot:Transcript_6844.p1 GENE.Transcript_6844~~Transcript_6844.p1  ORF type:complete len:294 (-),score=56.28 Transcript_6844:83-922(-)
MLSGLPPELGTEVARHLSAVGLLSMAAVSRASRTVADDDLVWRQLLARQLEPMVKAFFDGALPLPEAGHTWKIHYFVLRSTWKHLAQKRTGKLLVQIGTQRPSGREPHELISILDAGDLWWPTSPKTYGVYDVTTFVHRHPGADLIITDAAETADATHLFEINGHSDAALRMLTALAVPGLEALPYERELDALRRRRRRARDGWGAGDLLTAGLASGCVASLSDFLHEHPRFCFVPALWALGVAVAAASALWRKRHKSWAAAKKGWSWWFGTGLSFSLL